MKTGFSIKTHHLGLVINFAACLITLGGLSWIIIHVEKFQFFQIVRDLPIKYLLACVAAVLLNNMGSAARWNAVLHTQKAFSGKTSWIAIKGFYLAALLNCFLPSKGGDFAKAFLVRKHLGWSTGTGTVVLERLVDLVILSVLSLMTYAISKLNFALYASLVFLGIVSLIMICFLWVPLSRFPIPAKARLIAEDFQKVFRLWIKQPFWVSCSFLGSSFCWLLGGVCVWLLCLGVGAKISLLETLAVFPLAILAGLMPISISGIGVRDAAFVVLLVPYMSFEQATVVSLGYTVFIYWLPGLIAVLMLIMNVADFRRPKLS